MEKVSKQLETCTGRVGAWVGAGAQDQLQRKACCCVARFRAVTHTPLLPLSATRPRQAHAQVPVGLPGVDGRCRQRVRQSAHCFASLLLCVSATLGLSTSLLIVYCCSCRCLLSPLPTPRAMTVAQQQQQKQQQQEQQQQHQQQQQPPSLVVNVMPTDGSLLQCFFHAVGTALGIPHEPMAAAIATSAAAAGCSISAESRRQRWPELQRRLRSTLLSIRDARVLSQYGFSISPNGSAADLQRVQQEYLSSDDVRLQRWGGTQEMHLLAHESQGDLCFLTYNSTYSRHWDQIRCDASAAVRRPTRTIVLHTCSYTGGRTVNHYELVRYRTEVQQHPAAAAAAGAAAGAAAEFSSVWRIHKTEAPAERDRRTALISAACDQARDLALARSLLSNERDELLAEALAAHPQIRRLSPMRAKLAVPSVGRSAPVTPQRTRGIMQSRAIAASSDDAWWRQMQLGKPCLHPALKRAPAHLAPLCGVRLDGHRVAAPPFPVEVRIDAKLSAARLGQPLQFGLFASRQIGIGELVTAYGGVVRDLSDYLTRQPQDPLANKSYTRRVPSSNHLLDGLPVACMFRRPVVHTLRDLKLAVKAGMAPLLPSLADFSAAELDLFASSAFGFMANTAEREQCNVRVAYESVASGLLQVPQLVATRVIEAGTEIRCRYNSHEAKQLLAQPAAQSHECAEDWAPLLVDSSSPAHSEQARQPSSRVAAGSCAPQPKQLRSQVKSSAVLRQPVLPHVPASPACFTPEKQAVHRPLFPESPSCFTPGPPPAGKSSDSSPSCFTPDVRLTPRRSNSAAAAAVTGFPPAASPLRRTLECSLNAAATPFSLHPVSQRRRLQLQQPPRSCWAAPLGQAPGLQALTASSSGNMLSTIEEEDESIALDDSRSVSSSSSSTSASASSEPLSILGSLYSDASASAVDPPPHKCDRPRETRAAASEAQDMVDQPTESALPPAPPCRPRAAAHTANTMARLPKPPASGLSIRTQQQTEQLAGWKEYYAPLTADQRATIDAAYAKRVGWWNGFKKGRRKVAAKQLPNACAAAAIIPAALALSAASKAPKATMNRWYDAASLARDWAEFRCCDHGCGSANAAGVVAFFRTRLDYRALSVDRAAFATSVQMELMRAAAAAANFEPRCLLWAGALVCVSCYRAAVGLSRSGIYAHRHSLQQPAELAALSDLMDMDVTPFGVLRVPRRRSMTAHVQSLLLQYAQAFGQSAPNPKGGKTAEVTIYLPHTRMHDLQEALLKTDNSGRGIKESTLRRVVTELCVQGYTLSLKGGNTMCRCEHCDLLDKQKEELRASKANEDKRMFRIKSAMKDAHLRQVREQRDHVYAQQARAEQDPSKLFCFAYDGMDQKKTQLPHLKGRLPKNLEPLLHLGVHAVGAFCFGGPVPVMGFLNYPDVRKDGSLSVCILDHALDIQFKKLQQMHDKPTAAAGVSAHSAGVAAAAAAAAAHVPSPDGDCSARTSYRGVGLQWPERLHVTFDNAAGDAKNQYVFRYLGLLVLHGVFDAITVSNLIVGHTHDIVDQMFSVWAKLLRITDCKTFEQMRRLFHERYRSRVRLLVKLMRGDELSPEEAQDAGVAEPEEQEELRDERARCPHEWSSAALRYAERMSEELAKEAEAFNAAAAAPAAAAAAASSDDSGTGSTEEACQSASEFHTPHVVLQTHSFNIKSWMANMFPMASAHEAAAASSNGYGAASTMAGILNLGLADPEVEDEDAVPAEAEPSRAAAAAAAKGAAAVKKKASIVSHYKIKGLKNPHVFGIETDEAGDVWLYNKYLILSTEKSQRGERHQFLNRKTGDYTARCLLFRAADRAGSVPEPPLNPPELIEVDQIRATIAAYVRQEKLSVAEVAEWKQLLDGFASAQTRLQQQCARCASMMCKIKDIGVVSSKKDMSAAEQAAEQEKQRNRTQLRTALEAHLRDDAHAVDESILGANALPFFDKWLDRVRHDILPGYIERGVQTAPEWRTADYHLHPSKLCTDGRPGRQNKDNLIFETDGRMDAHYLLQNGPPEVTHYVLGRCNDLREPFGFGRIHYVFSAGEAIPPIWREERAAGGIAITEWFQNHKPVEADEAHVTVEPNVAAAAADERDAARPALAAGAAAGWALPERFHHADRQRVTVDLSTVPDVLVEWFNYPVHDVSALCLLDDTWWEGQIAMHADEDEAYAQRLGHQPPALRWVVDKYATIRFQQKAKADRCLVLLQGSQLIAWDNDMHHFLKRDDTLKLSAFKKLRFDLTEEQEPPQQRKAKEKSSTLIVVRGPLGKARSTKRRATSAAAESHCGSESEYIGADSEEAASPHRGRSSRPRRITATQRSMRVASDSDGEQEQENARAPSVPVAKRKRREKQASAAVLQRIHTPQPGDQLGRKRKRHVAATAGSGLVVPGRGNQTP